ncbi:MAG: dicarboxylate/amino acid:cation symporter [Prevotella sp.]|jgi:Na+/H+-dicarboxylate symporter
MKIKSQTKQLILWLGALVVGTLLGLVPGTLLHQVIDFVATVYIRLFQLLAVPTICLAIINTMIRFGLQKDTGRIFRHTITYTLLTTFAAATVGLILYNIIQPGNLSMSLISQGSSAIPESVANETYYDHIIGVIPNNIVKPFLDGNVLSILLLAFAIGIGIAKLPRKESTTSLINLMAGLQDLLFLLIRALIWTLPLGILAFAAQLSSQVSAGIAAQSLGKYVAVILGGNIIQFFVVLPLFLLARGLNPLRVLGKMSPAVLMALFTKSSAATLPVTMESAEKRLGVEPKVARFVLPICTTINMNGCAAFIFVTSVYLLQNGGIELSIWQMIGWLFIAVIAAIGNAGVPMGCFFLTLSLMTGTGAPIGLMGIILPVYTIIDMIETAENVWSDSCVCAMTDHDLRAHEG